MNKVIFMDIDGVLNSIGYFKRIEAMGMDLSGLSFSSRSLYEIDPAPVQLLSDFAEETSAAIVISSSWRILHSIEEISDLLKKCGWGSRPLIDKTPRVPSGFRGDEVNLWLQANPQAGPHVIFDDDGDFHKDQPLVQTDWATGLLPEHIDRAREILNRT